ncbi:HyaD/HybD family hydrogenase maturation endopeptidase [Rhodocyclus tenuis]|uniref:HyaD/HybD family hydrogenase maturation endopeptidase n=1 Tax=Rhodocyclus tenuis TaxID=1066 RepID=UPI0030B8A7FF
MSGPTDRRRVLNEELSTESDILVLGIGNILWADEGFGVRALEALDAAYTFPDEVRLMDGGTQGLYLLPYVQGARRVIVFDAVDYGLPPGTFKLVRNADIPAYLGIRKMSLHQSSFQEVLSLAMFSGQFPEDMLLIGVQPEDVSDYGGSLRDSVRACLPQAIGVALETLASWGCPGTPRPAVPAAAPAGPADASDCLSMDAYEAGRPSEDQAWRMGDARVANQLFSGGEA